MAGSLPYRPEVDGLRAVAVLSVLFFHGGVPGFRGGFVGVDVFFVISGYLITRLILDELDGGRFAFSAFYVRRARRLLPALFVTMAATLAGSVWLLSPPHLEDCARAFLCALVSASNVHFWTTAGYFDTASEVKPLLHTWSLGVEEQFYLLWPISVVAAYRLGGRRGVGALTLVAGVASLAAAEYAAGVAPEAAFFLTPFRIGELALGAACLWWEQPSARGASWRREVLTLSGLAVVAYAVATYSTDGRFPGLTAMVPCGGAALVIVAGRTRVAGALLANRAAVGIGLISYSLYLVHWPLWVLRRYGRPDAAGASEKAVLLAGSIALAAALYFLVEQPFRRPRGRLFGSNRAFAGACAGLVVGLALPAIALATGRWPSSSGDRLRATAREIPSMKKHHFDDAMARYARPFPVPGRRNVVIVGDSYGADLLTALVQSDSSVNVRLLDVHWYCQPILGVRPYGEGTPIRTREIAASCRAQGSHLRDNPYLEAADEILITSRWLSYGLDGLPRTLEYMKDRYRARIVLLGGRYAFSDASTLLAGATTIADVNERFDASKGTSERQLEMDRLSAIAAEAGVELIDLRPYACDPTASGWYCPLLFEDGGLLYWDGQHWTPAGARRVGLRLRASGREPFLF